MPKDDTALVKGLRILELLNRQTTMRIMDLHAETGVSQPTIVRILGALQSMGYVTRVSRSAGYTVSSRVLSLSSGFHGAPRLVEIAAPVLDRLTQDVLWPASLATLDIDAMVVRYSTIPLSPLSHKQSTIHHRLGLSGRAHGRIYLACCPPRERRALLAGIADTEASYLRRHLSRFRRQGWADRHPTLDPQTNSIAVPVFGERERVLATVGLTFFRKAVSAGDHQALLSALKVAAEDVARLAR